MKLTDEQCYAVDLATKGHGNLKIEAFAGTGKTTTLKAIGNAKKGERGIYLAFNKAIADTAGTTFPRNVQCKTAHALAFRDVGSIYQKRLGRLTSVRLASELGIFEWEGIKAAKLCSLAQQTVNRFCQGDSPIIGRKHIPKESLKPMIQKGLDVDSIAERILFISNQFWRAMENPNGTLPVTHDFYLKKWALTDPKLNLDFVLFDEAQDANPLILKVLQNQPCQVIFVGDEYQQIYSWRGAVNAMRNFATNSVARLTQSFRFGQEIADIANEVLVDLLGSNVKILGNPNVTSNVKSIAHPEAILCRTNAEAIAQLTYCLRHSRRPALQGGTKEISALVRGIQDLQEGRLPSVPELEQFTDWEQLEEYSKSEMGQDLAPVLKLVEQYGTSELIQVFEQVAGIAEHTADVVISTAHKAKGREWSSVKLGSDYRSPGDKKGYHREEGNLLYVAVTRAINTLDLTECEAIEQIRKLKAEKEEEARENESWSRKPLSPDLLSPDLIDEPSPSEVLAVLDSFWAARSDEAFHTTESPSKVGESSPLQVTAEVRPSMAEAGAPSASDVRKKLTGAKALAASEFLLRAKRDGKDGLIGSSSPADAWATLDLATQDEDRLNQWVESHLSKKGRERMLATLRQASFKASNSLRSFEVRTEVADRISAQAKACGLSLSDFLSKLSALHDAQLLASPADESSIGYSL
jgi:macrodomain Ter protein organizer (MatP/YcbG family)